MTTYTVRTAGELSSVLAKAAGGDIIQLAAGDYGDVSISGIKAGTPITITSADPGDPATLNTLHMRDCANVAVAGLNIDFTPDEETVTWSSAVRIESSTDVDLTDCTITGGPSVRGVDPSAPAGTQGSEGILGLPIGIAVTVLWCEDVSLSGNTISEFQKGIKFEDVHGVTVADNEVFDIRTTQLSGANCDDVLVENNYFHSSHPWNYGGAGDHGDYIHFWTVPEQDGPSLNYVIRNNVMAQGDGEPIMGIYFDDNSNNKGYENVLIENNVIHTGHTQGILIEDVDGLSILGNSLIQSSGEPNNAPRIVLADGSSDVLIDGNILSGLDTARGTNVRIGDNVTVQIHDPFAPFYAGDLFADALGGNVNGLFALPGSAASGYGADVIAASAFVGSEHGEGLALNAHTFTLEGMAIPSGATVRWDLGDGTWATGETVSHRYATPGEHVVVAHVEDGGAVRLVARTILTLDPAPVMMSFDAPAGLSSMLQASAMVADAYGSAKLVASDHGQSVRLAADKAAIAIENSPEITTNPEFSLTVGFQKDAGHEAEGGRILYFSGTAVVDIGADSVTLRGRTDIGETITLRAFGAGVQDADWHQITYTFSQEDGTAILYLDGEEVARMEGLKGSQHVTGGHDLHLGNPYGANMDGLLDDLAFVRASLSPEEVRDSYARFAVGQPLDFGVTQDLYVPDSEAEGLPNDEPLPVAVPVGPVLPDLADAKVAFDLDGSDPSGFRITKGAQVTANGDGFTARLAGDGGLIDLGDLGRPEDDGSITVDLTFDRNGTLDGAERILWNHGTFGVELSDGQVTVLAGTADGRLTRFKADAAGIGDDAAHHLRISVDSELDRIQIVVDGQVVLDDDSHDLELSRVAEANDNHDWTLGTAWNRYFDGEITDLTIADDAVFLDLPDQNGTWTESQMLG